MKKREFLNKPLGDTEWLLEQWGWWRMDGSGVPRYVSPLHALIRDNTNYQGGPKQYSILDDTALFIDGAVARLSARDQQMGDFIWLYFGAKWPALRIARDNGMGEAKAREIIKAGVAWIDCALEGLREAA
ncbi:antiterminator Q family protein [Pseudomonas sp. TTU2014-080ASC]|uniref:antiterminator Q family protein n=1 Tax=Pseudomonas sp. TTU2014-080ASC TaxID=1729724 RepID=UPI0007186E29|nr:antiterminator Q family protein [Pseudomonas sp. TTU2014-080ASC]KRW62352.1 antitermination protein Q [Pseudomonas sp. TTU2014-080ASC]